MAWNLFYWNYSFRINFPIKLMANHSYRIVKLVLF